jgi:hypothetical protein
MRQILKYYWALLLGAVLLLVAFQGEYPGRTSSAGAAAKGPKSEPVLTQVWSRTLPGQPVQIAMSPDGALAAAVGSDGAITCFSAKGGILWRTTIHGVDQVALGPDGSAIACSLLSPSENVVHFISPSGELEWHTDLRGAIWSIGASSELGRFVAGTGERYCYVFNVTNGRHRFRRWRVPGVPCSAAFSPDAKTIVLGTWQDAGIGIYSLTGDKISWWQGEQDRLYSVGMTLEGNAVAAIARPNPDLPIATICLKDHGLADVWTSEFKFPAVESDTSRAGDYTAVGFLHTMVHRDKEISERRIAVYDRAGHRLWEKGGIFGQWNLVQVCASGNLLLYDDSPSLSLVSRDGDVLVRSKLTGIVRAFARSPHRDKAAIFCSDGTLRVFETR